MMQAQPPFLYRAIKLNINLYRWERALELAQLGKAHLDTVVGYRQRFLATMGRKETDDKFIAAAASVTVDWDVIKVCVCFHFRLVGAQCITVCPVAEKQGGGKTTDGLRCGSGCWRPWVWWFQTCRAW